VDEAAVKIIRDWMLAPDNSAHNFPADFTPVRDAGAPLAAGFLLAALAATPAEPVDPAVVGRMTDYYASVQEDDGSWIMGSVQGRPPIFQGPGTTTRVMRLGAGDFPRRSPLHRGTGRCVAGGEHRRPDAAGTSTGFVAGRQVEAIARAHCGTRQGTAGAARRGRIVATDSQHGRGCLRHGQALYALTQTGQGDDVARSRAVGFLLETQQPDGSWRMFSRPSQGTSDPLHEGTEPISAGRSSDCLGAE
jgi:hypothetical protein